MRVPRESLAGVKRLQSFAELALELLCRALKLVGKDGARP